MRMRIVKYSIMKDIMAPTRKRSKLGNYFEKLNHLLVKCTTCKKEIKTPNPTRRTKIMRAHILNVHGISLDDETVTLPDDLKQYYSELPGYKAKCNNCGKAVSFLTNIENLRVHLRRHSTRILSRDETVLMALKRKRSKLWNYFEELNPSLIKCTTCKKEIKTPIPTRRTKVMRIHLSRHGIFIDNDTHTLPDDLKQYYSELPGYKAKCKDCDKTLSFLTNMGDLRKHLRRHSTRILSRDETVLMALKRKRSKLWNYFEELNPSLIKCTTCKKEIKTPNPTRCTRVMRIHLSRHGIFIDNDTHTLPDDLKQYYSKLPGYKAKCNNCGKAVSFLTNMGNLRKHLRRHSTRILSRDETVLMALKRKRSKLWNYFEELNPSLIKCTTWKKEIKTPNPTRRTKVMRIHLSRHGISLDDETVTLPDDLKQYYSELPGYKAKCNNCGKAVSFLTNIENLRVHLRRHSTRILSRDETVLMALKRKRSKLWNYFEELKPLLVKCTTCKKEIKTPNPTKRTRTMRIHLSRHGIFLDNGIHTLPDDLKEYYSELPGYKAKCKNCDKTLSFLTNMGNLRKHLRRRHSTIIQGRDETVIMALKRKRSKLWNYFEELKPSLAKCTTCKKEIKISRPSNRTRIFRAHLKRHGIFLDNDIRTLPDDLRQYYSELPGYKAKCNDCSKIFTFLTSIEYLRKHLRRHSTTIQSGYETTPRKERSKLWNYFEELKPTLVKCTTCKKEIKIPDPKKCLKIMRIHLSRHGIFLDNNTLSLPDNLRQCYSELPGYKAKCNNCGETISFLTDVGLLRRHLRRHSTIIQGRDETVMVPRKKRSKLWNYFEQLKPTLVKCTTCKKEIKISYPKHYTRVMRMHLSRHGISLDNDTLSLPDNLRQCYSELPGYKAKCNNCGETISFLTDVGLLQRHLRRHSTIIQGRDETVMVPRKKRSKFWNYFEELKPLLIKCTTCKKEIKVSESTYYTKLMRLHLSRHGIFIDNDTYTLPDDLKQYYSELPRYKAKCNNCGKTLSFLTSMVHLRVHLRRHSTRIQSRDKTTPTKKRSKLWNYFEELNPSLVKCTTCKKEFKIPDSKKRTKIMKAHSLNVHGISLDDDTVTLPDDLRQHYSELPRYKAKCNDCGKAVSFLSNIAHLRKHLKRHSTRNQSRDETTPTKKRSKLWNYFEELNPSLVKCTTCKKEIKISRPSNRITIFRVHLKRHGIFLDNDIRTLPTDLRQCYSELPGYKAKCNNCGETLSFLTDVKSLRRHLRRHSTRIQSQDETVMVPRKKTRKKRSKFWNYFEELKPLLVKCTTCKREIKVSHPKQYTNVMRLHLSRHGIFLDNDTLSLPDDLKQNYSELPGYKAKCNNCGATVSFLRNIANLRRHLKRHSTIIQSRDETIIMAPRRSSKLWNYFEELKPTLVKCTTCKKEIKISRPSNRITIFRAHLKRHGIFLENNTVTLPDNLRQCYSELPGYKAKCNNCGETVSFLTNVANLRRHLRKHSTSIQSPDETVMVPAKKRSKFWNYFEELKSTLVKCTTCKKEIKVSHPTDCTRIFRAHLLNVHGISLDDDTLTLPDDLKQYYSELPGYKAKCNNCAKAVSFLSNIAHLRKHLKRHSTRNQSRDETTPTKKRSKLWNYFEELKPTLVKCTTCKREIKVSHPNHYTKVMRIHLSRHGIFLDNDTYTLPDDLKQNYSELPGYKAKCNNCGKAVSFLTNIARLRKHLRRHSTRILSRDETVMVPRKKRSKLWTYFKKLKPSLVKHGIFLNNDTFALPDDLRQHYSELPRYKAKCNDCGKTMSFLTNIVRLRKHLRRHSTRILSRDEPSSSSLADNSIDPSADRQSQDTSDLPIQSLKEAIEKTGALDKPSTLSSTAYIMYLSTGEYIPLRQSQEQVPSTHLPVQSFKETAENTVALDEPSTSTLADYSMDPSSERQSQEYRVCLFTHLNK
ncbi:uncharacterized protein [Temnothorax nylanderi]|uniref:uncharacterized protein isoform X4 n=1 Tax=Temnothorax nylanderi TaxID=102681 RepID=UPI003A8ACA6E